MGILVNANELLQKKGESMTTWEWPEQSKSLDLETVKTMICDHNPNNLKTTIKMHDDILYCLKCWKNIGYIEDYQFSDGDF